jgi:OOP family OmpA-OmpF porin
MRIPISRLVVGCGIVATLPAPTWAVEPAAVEVGAFGGYNVLSANSELGDAAVADYVPASAPLLGLRGGYWVNSWLAAEVETKYAPAQFRSGGISAGVLGARAHARAILTPNLAVQVFATLGMGAERLMTDPRPALSNSDVDAAYIAGLGVRVPLTDRLGARVDSRFLLVPGREGMALNQEYHFGVYLQLGTGSDATPTAADRDNDGVPDARDRCPDQPEVRNGIDDDDGCPDTDPDADGDGIADSRDKCPNEPETRNGYQDDDGCPDAAPDADKDGIADARDKCPTEAETVNGYQDDDGCPDKAPDGDGDGVADSRDKCPTQPETKNGFQDEDGCPDEVPTALKKVVGAIRGIEFAENQAEITKSSYKVLNTVVETLKAQSDSRVVVEGHTDNTGTPERNRELGLARAEAVKSYLVSKGIAAERITTVGFGSDKPVADNSTADGRAKNRRIEFKLQ